MTKKDYVLIAEKVNYAFSKLNEKDKNGFNVCLQAVMEALTKDNPNFRPITFYQACTKEEED